MTDIVERLGRDLMEISYDDIEAMVREAATEIERLRAALRTITIGGIGENNWSTFEMRAYAEDALKP